jgi:hypothetical protein
MNAPARLGRRVGWIRAGMVAVLLLGLGGQPVTGWAAPGEEGFALVPSLFPALAASMQELPPFLRDTRLTLHFRTFYRNNEPSDGVYQEAWAFGGWLAYRSGWLADTFSVGATGFASLPIYAPDDRDGTLLLKPGQEGFGVLGEAFARLRYADHVLTGYRQSVNVGYVNPQDNRMVPNTFEGAMLAGKLDWLSYSAGYLTTIKPRAEDDFLSMAEQAGAPAGSDDGLALVMLRVTPAKGLALDAGTFFGVNTFNTAFGQAEYTRPLAEDVALTIGVQYTDERSVGDELVGAFDTWNVGGRARLTYRAAALEVAVHQTGDGSDIRTPFGTWPGYLSLINKDFDRAGETGLGVRLLYDFTRLGVPGLSVAFVAAQGTGARVASTGAAAPDRREYDFDVTYAPPAGPLRGLSIRLRAALVDQDGVPGLLPDIRLILNYPLPLL